MDNYTVLSIPEISNERQFGLLELMVVYIIMILQLINMLHLVGCRVS